MEPKPILLIDDDNEDLQMFRDAFNDLEVENEILTFTDAETALEFLKTSTQQFLFILCDINMPKINGLNLRQKIYDDEELRHRSIPFLFLSTANDRVFIDKAYHLSVQGYFRKPALISEIREMLRSIIIYWEYSYHPNNSSAHRIVHQQLH